MWSRCSTTHDDCTAHHLELVYYVIRVILTSMMVLMCWSFRGLALYRSLFVTLALATFAAAMSCLWVDTWITELTENLSHARRLRRHHNLTRTAPPVVDSDAVDHHNHSHSYNRTRACLAGNTTIDNLLQGYERFFYPCTFELALLVIHCVIHWYSNSELSPPPPPSASSLSSPSSSPSLHHQTTETTALLSNRTFRSTDCPRVGRGGEDDVIVTSSTDRGDVIMCGQYSMSLIIVSTLVNIVYCQLAFLAVYGHVHYFDNLFYRVRIWYEMFYHALMIAVLAVGLFLAGSSSATSAASKRQSHSGVEYLVLFTSWAPVIKSLLTIILYTKGGHRDWITLPVKTANVLGQTTAILHVAVQTVFVFYAKNFRYPQPSSLVERDKWRRRRSQFRVVLLVVALSDISFWVASSFVEINMAYGYSYHCSYFYHWIPLVSFIAPVAIFYYFNCALLCLDVFLNC